MMRSLNPSTEPATGQTMYVKPPPSAAHNLTGLYLGSENVTYPSNTTQSAHPMYRGRARTVNSRTTIEERRHKMVEFLRDKEEKLLGPKNVNRGFSGKTLKNRATPLESEVLHATSTKNQPVLTVHSEVLPIWDLTRKTARNFTPSSNSGVTHLEYLCPTEVDETSHTGDTFNMSMKDTVMNEVHRIANDKQNFDLYGLAECYQKICKGNIDSLEHLMPNKKPTATPVRNPSGFSVKGLRNPAKAEILSDFPQSGRRPHTVLGSHSPFKPNHSSYFYKTFHAPKGYTDAQYKYGGSRGPHNTSSHPHHPHDSKGQRSNQTGWQEHNYRSGNKSAVPPLGSGISRGHPNTPIYPRSINEGSAFANRRADISVPAPSEATSVGRQTPSTNVDFPQSAAGATGLDSIAEKSARTEQQNHNVTEMSTTAVASGHIPVQTVVTTDAGTAAEQAMEGASNIVRTASCAEIQIGVEAENGEQVPLEIDDDDAQNAKEKPEDNNTLNTTVPDGPSSPGGRRVSIAERVLQNKTTQEEMAANMEGRAESRKREFEELLSEHAQIVKEVFHMQGEPETEGSGADKENNAYTSSPGVAMENSNPDVVTAE